MATFAELLVLVLVFGVFACCVFADIVDDVLFGRPQRPPGPPPRGAARSARLAALNARPGGLPRAVARPARSWR